MVSSKNSDKSTPNQTKGNIFRLSAITALITLIVIILDVGNIYSSSSNKLKEYINYVFLLNQTHLKNKVPQNIALVELRDKDLKDDTLSVDGCIGFPPSYLLYNNVLNKIHQQKPKAVFIDINFPLLRRYDKCGYRKFSELMNKISSESEFPVYFSGVSRRNGNCVYITEEIFLRLWGVNPAQFLDSTDINNRAKGEKFRVALKNKKCLESNQEKSIYTAFVRALYKEVTGNELPSNIDEEMQVLWDYTDFKGNNGTPNFLQRLLTNTDRSMSQINNDDLLEWDHFVYPVSAISDLDDNSSTLKDKVVVLSANHSYQSSNYALLGYKERIPKTRFILMAVHNLIAMDMQYIRSLSSWAEAVIQALFVFCSVFILSFTASMYWVKQLVYRIFLVFSVGIIFYFSINKFNVDLTLLPLLIVFCVALLRQLLEGIINVFWVVTGKWT